MDKASSTKITSVKKTGTLRVQGDIQAILELTGQNLQLTEKQKSILETYTKKTIFGFNLTNVLVCKGEECAFFNTCEFKEDDGSFPQNLLNNLCAKELVQFSQNLQLLLEELEINPWAEDSKVSEFRTVLQIAQLNLLIDRIEKQFAEDNVLVESYKDTTQGVYTEKIAHPLFKEFSKLIKTKKELHESLLNTRQTRPRVIGVKLKNKIDDEEAEIILNELEKKDIKESNSV